MNIHINQDKFWEFLHNNVDLNKYEHKFLRQDIGRLKSGTQRVYSDSFFNIQGDSWILIIHSDALLIYGDNWSENQFKEIEKSIDLNKFRNHVLAGESNLITALIKFFYVTNFRIEKERNFYRANNISEFHSEETIIRTANYKDTSTLASMLQQYYHEEYDGENDKELSEMTSRIESYISDESIYVLVEPNNELASFCTIINPDIGILFTNHRFRKRGYGKQILSHCSKILLSDNSEVYLMTDRSKLESNAVCRKVGYISFYEFSLIGINNS